MDRASSLPDKAEGHLAHTARLPDHEWILPDKAAGVAEEVAGAVVAEEVVGAQDIPQ
jgi:hypothetical protein